MRALFWSPSSLWFIRAPPVPWPPKCRSPAPLLLPAVSTGDSVSFTTCSLSPRAGGTLESSHFLQSPDLSPPWAFLSLTRAAEVRMITGFNRSATPAPSYAGPCKWPSALDTVLEVEGLEAAPHRLLLVGGWPIRYRCSWSSEPFIPVFVPPSHV